MSLRVRAFIALCLTLLVTAGCGGEPPDKEMQQAQGAIDAARAAGADVYAKDEFAAAQLALDNAKAAVEQRDYRLALNHALDSRELAQVAAKSGADNKAAARAAAERAMTAADAALTEAKAKLTTAETRRVQARLLSGPRATIDTAEAQLQETRAIFDEGKYLDIPARASAATALLSGLSEQLDALLSAPARRRR